ncbi:MAG: hypothetical protein JXA71_05920 [Chitinispirillaceae bacterium]|nr:hypothetical protein [Chitinispirillaceae bacterium]
MSSKRCRLYDENLVHNIMLSTGLSVVEFMRDNGNADSDEVCDFVEANAEVIINDTIRHLKSINDFQAKGEDDTKSGSDTKDWPGKEEE